ARRGRGCRMENAARYYRPLPLSRLPPGQPRCCQHRWKQLPPRRFGPLPKWRVAHPENWHPCRILTLETDLIHFPISLYPPNHMKASTPKLIKTPADHEAALRRLEDLMQMDSP